MLETRRAELVDAFRIFVAHACERSEAVSLVTLRPVWLCSPLHQAGRYLAASRRRA